jgi:hypothetical protein
MSKVTSRPGGLVVAERPSSRIDLGNATARRLGPRLMDVSEPLKKKLPNPTWSNLCFSPNVTSMVPTPLTSLSRSTVMGAGPDHRRTDLAPWYTRFQASRDLPYLYITISHPRAPCDRLAGGLTVYAVTLTES